jgi:hypothetical protein
MKIQTVLRLLPISLLALALLLAHPLAKADPGSIAPPPAAIQQTADIEAFVREGCPHCQQAEAFLGKLQQQYPLLRISIRDVSRDPSALDRLKQLAQAQAGATPRVPAFQVRDQLIVGYSEEAHSGDLILSALQGGSGPADPANGGSSSCEAEESLSCKPEEMTRGPAKPEQFRVTLFGREITLGDVGLPAFTLAMGLLDGFNPCSMWVLLLMISLLAPMGDRRRMLVIAGSFVLVEGIAYYLFMAAWLNLFLFIGLSRLSELAIAAIAILAGAINLKDFWVFGRGLSLSIPKSAKPGIYTRMRAVLQAENLAGALVGIVVLAVLVQIVEFLCTSGFPALFTRILTLHQMEGVRYYGYLLLYNLAYMLDDIIILGIGVVTLSQHRLQEREGRWLKLLSGAVMVGLGVYLILRQP